MFLRTSTWFALTAVLVGCIPLLATGQLRPDPNAPGSAWGADQIAQLIAGLGGDTPSTGPTVSSRPLAAMASAPSAPSIAHSMFQSDMHERPEPGSNGAPPPWYAPQAPAHDDRDDRGHHDDRDDDEDDDEEGDDEDGDDDYRDEDEYHSHEHREAAAHAHEPTSPEHRPVDADRGGSHWDNEDDRRDSRRRRYDDDRDRKRDPRDDRDRDSDYRRGDHDRDRDHGADYRRSADERDRSPRFRHDDERQGYRDPHSTLDSAAHAGPPENAPRYELDQPFGATVAPSPQSVYPPRNAVMRPGGSARAQPLDFSSSDEGVSTAPVSAEHARNNRVAGGASDSSSYGDQQQQRDLPVPRPPAPEPARPGVPIPDNPDIPVDEDAQAPAAAASAIGDYTPQFQDRNRPATTQSAKGVYVNPVLACILANCSQQYLRCISNSGCANVFECLQSEVAMPSCVKFHDTLQKADQDIFGELGNCEEKFECFVHAPPAADAHAAESNATARAAAPKAPDTVPAGTITPSAATTPVSAENTPVAAPAVPVVNASSTPPAAVPSANASAPANSSVEPVHALGDVGDPLPAAQRVRLMTHDGSEHRTSDVSSHNDTANAAQAVTAQNASLTANKPWVPSPQHPYPTHRQTCDELCDQQCNLTAQTRGPTNPLYCRIACGIACFKARYVVSL